MVNMAEHIWPLTFVIVLWFVSTGLIFWLDSRPALFPMTWPLTIMGYASFEHTLDPVAVRRIVAFLTAGLRTGALRPVIDRVFTLDDIADAHRYLEKGQQVGKIVVSVPSR